MNTLQDWFRESKSLREELISTIALCVCPDCNGDGKETCNNPDHGFREAMQSRLGCPVCGHDETNKVPNGGDCETCLGDKNVPEEVAIVFFNDNGLDKDDWIEYI